MGAGSGEKPLDNQQRPSVAAVAKLRYRINQRTGGSTGCKRAALPSSADLPQVYSDIASTIGRLCVFESTLNHIDFTVTSPVS